MIIPLGDLADTAVAECSPDTAHEHNTAPWKCPFLIQKSMPKETNLALKNYHQGTYIRVNSYIAK